MRTTTFARLLALVLGTAGTAGTWGIARAEAPAPSTAPPESTLGRILDDEAGDDTTKRVVVGLLWTGGGLALIPPGVSLMDGGGLPAIAGVVVLGMSAGMVISGIVTLAGETELEELAEDHARAARRGEPDEVFAQRLAVLAARAESRRYLTGGLLAITGVVTLVPALEEGDPVAGVAGSLGIAFGIYSLLVLSNAEDAFERYLALEPSGRAGIRLTPTFGVSADGLALGVSGTF